MPGQIPNARFPDNALAENTRIERVMIRRNCRAEGYAVLCQHDIGRIGVAVVRYDFRGFGRSTAGSQSGTHVADLKALLDHLELVSVSLVGISLGGGVAIDFATAYPNAVRALILVDPLLEGTAAAHLGDVAVPTLVAVGALDAQDAQERASALEAGMPDAWKVVVPGAGRMVNLDDPKRFNEIVMAFLAETERKSRR